MNLYSKFDQIFDKATSSKIIQEAVCLIENSGGDFSATSFKIGNFSKRLNDPKGQSPRVQNWQFQQKIKRPEGTVPTGSPRVQETKTVRLFADRKGEFT